MNVFSLRFLLFGVFLMSLMSAQAQIDFCRDLREMVEAVGYYHLKAYSGQTHQRVWIRESMETLDRSGVYWLAADEAELSGMFGGFAGLSSSQCDGFEEVVSRYRQRLQEAIHLLDSLESLPFDDSLQVDSWLKGPDLAFPADAAERRLRWAARVQVRSLRDFFYAAENPEQLTESDFLHDWDTLRNANIRKLRCAVQQALDPPGGLDQTVARVMLNALLETFDPHSNFFSQSEQTLFEASLSSSSLSFGLEFRQNDQGTFEVSSLQPGGSAWRSNLINQGDVLVSVSTGDGISLDLTCASLRDLRMFVGQDKARTLILEVRKETGEQRLVTLSKSRVQVEENIVTGFVLDGREPVGYLYLPGFYTNWETDGQVTGLANDVAIELLRLKMEGAKGLVLDLRNNGGGSMREAIALAGIFIDQGPLSIMVRRDGEPEVLKDFHRGVGYGDPMVVMVNGYSASASELFAAAMQDYHRAVVVGDTTFGKATSQIMLPLNGGRGQSATGFLKLTTGEFHRVTGKTHQQEGIIPDIPYPELWEATMNRERELPFVVASDAIDPPKPFDALSPLPLDRLRDASMRRQNESSYISGLLAWQQHVPDMMTEAAELELQFSGFQEQFFARQNMIASLDGLLEDYSPPFDIRNHRSVASLIRLDEARKAMNEQQISQILEDPAIAEAYEILSDLLVGP